MCRVCVRLYQRRARDMQRWVWSEMRPVHIYHGTVFIPDDDECEKGVASCRDDTYCENTPGKYTCKGERELLWSILGNPLRSYRHPPIGFIQFMLML